MYSDLAILYLSTFGLAERDNGHAMSRVMKSRVMNKTLPYVMIAATLFAPVSAFAQQPAAQPAAGTTDAPDPSKVAEARVRYDRGLKLYYDGNIEAARVEFERAYQLAPSYKILYNTGLCYRQLNDYVAALDALERYLKEGGTEIPNDRRAEVEKTLAEIRPRLATLDIRTNVPGAEISIDDAPIGKTPLPAPVRVNPGRRKVTATKSGRFPINRSITVGGSEQQTVILELEAPKTVVVTKGTNLTPYVLWGVTGLLAVGAGVTGVLALNASSDQKDKLASPNASQSDLADGRSKMRTFSVVADVLTGAAVIAGGAALYLTLKRPHKDDAPPPSASIQDLRIGLRPGGAVFVGSF